LSVDDFRHGMMAWRKRNAWRRWNYWIGLAVMPPVLVLNAALLIWYPHAEFKQIQWIAVGTSALWLTSISAQPWFSEHLQFHRMPLAQSPTTLSVSESGLRMQSKHADSQLAWSAFIGWREEKTVFVIFPQPRTYVPVPKRAFTEQQ